MKILGIDPGLTRCGIAVVESFPGRKLSPIAVEVLRTSKDLELPQRLLQLNEKLEKFLDSYQPDELSIERVFSQANVSTATGTAQAAGVAALLAAQREIPVMFYTPTAVKQAVTGNGRANKQQVIFMVGKLLKLTEEIRVADAADACALAICHAWQQPFLSNLSRVKTNKFSNSLQFKR